MKAHLMFRDRDFDPQGSLPPFEAALTQDLELNTLLAGMAAGDPFLLEAVRKAVLCSLDAPDAILYRQRILADCFNYPGVVRELYSIAVEAIDSERRVWGWYSRDPGGLLHRSLDLLRMFVGLLKKLRRLADQHHTHFRSEGFTTIFAMLAKELDDSYLAIVEGHLRRLELEDGVLMSAELGEGNKGTDYVLRKPDVEPGWSDRVKYWMAETFFSDRTANAYRVDDRDEAGHRALEELRGEGIRLVAIALAQSTDHLLSFFSMLRWELGFYVGCLNLRDLLAKKGEPICFPEPLPSDESLLSCRAVYDVCLSLSMEQRVIGNDVNAAGKSLTIITGANRGGKSTFLRSVGLAQLMTQCGMFVPAESFRANVCKSIFTHFKREEDAGMRSGKLDEELGRMSKIVDHLTAGSMMLFNESFASTNEREGSEIARQIVRALLEKGIKVFYVTHLFDLAQGFHGAKMDTALFLRAERLADGQRTFRLVEGEPLPTSFGEDLYRRIFRGAISAAAPT